MPFIGSRRDRAYRYVFMMLVAFGITVVAVRLYLNAAGYPQIGGGGIHVAHLLWGGLLLIIAVLLPLLRVGRRALMVSATLAGVGVGLFIDEVGKFITSSNDYFYPLAAPIIYGALLVISLIWLQAQPTWDEVLTAVGLNRRGPEGLRPLCSSVALRNNPAPRYVHSCWQCCRASRRPCPSSQRLADLGGDRALHLFSFTKHTSGR